MLRSNSLRTEATRTPTTQYQASHATEVSHAHAHPHTDRLGVEHLHIAEAYSPDHQAPQMEDPHANQIPPYFLPPSYIPTFAPQFTYETDPSLRAMVSHVFSQVNFRLARVRSKSSSRISTQPWLSARHSRFQVWRKHLRRK